MAIDFTGRALQAPRIATANARTTEEPSSGVPRVIVPCPGTGPALVDAYADQYVSSVLDGPGGTVEYLVWAASTTNLATVEDPDWWIAGAGVLSETTPNRILVSDAGGRDIAGFLALVVARGDVSTYDDAGWIDSENPSLGRKGSNPYPFITLLAPQGAVRDVLDLSGSQLDPFGGILSASRGDQVIEARYYLAGPSFWWTRNDRQVTRFGWDARVGRWVPRKASPIANLGKVQAAGGSFTLVPPPAGISIGEYLPGDRAIPDSKAMLRAGDTPGASSDPIAQASTGTPPWGGILVVADSAVAGHVFAPGEAGILGAVQGTLVLNPLYAQTIAGRDLWYAPNVFSDKSDGILGPVGETLYMAPIPLTTEGPLLRLGSRRYLDVILADDDDTMAGWGNPAEGSAYVSAASGRIRLSPLDEAKANPADPSFDAAMYGEVLVCDGLALCPRPQPLRKPTKLIRGDGLAGSVGETLYLPDATIFPSSYVGADAYRGLGTSGMVDVPDGTGSLYASPGSAAPARPGGDTTGATVTGRIRRSSDGVGDSLLFTKRGAFADLVEHVSASTVPSKGIPQGTAHVILPKTGVLGSRIVLGKADIAKAKGLPAWFLQTSLTPSFWTARARLVSRFKGPYALDGTEKLYFHTNGLSFTWAASSLVVPGQISYSANNVAASINAIAIGAASTQDGHLVVKGTVSVSIDWGPSGFSDLSGCARLGLNPGWKAVEGIGCWLPDTGVSLGLFRTPVNIDRSNEVPDVVSTSRVDSIVLQDPTLPIPHLYLERVPLQDQIGFDKGLFFRLVAAGGDGDEVSSSARDLRNWQDVIYRFASGRFDWIVSGTAGGLVSKPTVALDLGTAGVVPETLDGIGGSLRVAETGGAYALQTSGSDFLLDGDRGVASLVSRRGGLVTPGFQGSFSGGVFHDGNFDWSALGVQLGWRLKIGGRSYLVTAFAEGDFVVSPAPADDPGPFEWQLYRGLPDSVYDPSVLADASWVPFSHLSAEPFRALLSSPVGAVPASAGAQESSRLRANLTGAIASNREMVLSIGLDPVIPSLALVPLTSLDLGVLANGSLHVPLVAPRFATGAFSLRIGAVRHIVTLVSSLSPGDPLTIECETGAGLLKFPSALLASYAGASVQYVEEFLDPSLLGSSSCEVKLGSGLLNLPVSAMAHAGMMAFLTETLVLEGGKDGSVAPLTGSLALRHPMSTGQVLTLSYWKADENGRKEGAPIVEILSSWVREESAVQGPGNWFFNGAGRILDTGISPSVRVGPIVLEPSQYELTWPSTPTGQAVIRILGSQPQAGVVPKVGYAILDAAGGELAYQASNRPLYRPPFFVKSGTSIIPFWGNRLADLAPGVALRIGDEVTYVRESAYDAGRGVTRIVVFPPFASEAGSRAPGQPSNAWVSQGPIPHVVDPNGITPLTITDSLPGFLTPISQGDFPFEPISKGQAEVRFLGDLTAFAKPGHLLEIGGHPHLVAGSALSSDGDRTIVRLTSATRASFNVAQAPSVSLSFRPIFPAGAVDLVAPSPTVPAQGYELVSWIGNLPGRTLTRGSEWDLAPDTGAVSLSRPLLPGERLVLDHVAVRTLAASVSNGQLLSPRWDSSFKRLANPSENNGLAGKLVASFRYASPDSFYVRIASMSAIASEASKQASRDAAAGSPAGGSNPVSLTKAHDWEQGRLGPRGEIQALSELDRSARAFVSFHDSVTTAFEQVGEAVQGEFVGDRVGRVRLGIGRGVLPTPPGFEDPITGELVPRDVWALAYEEWNPTPGTSYAPGDGILDPSTVAVSDGSVSGELPDASSLSQMISSQRRLIQNDVDDIVLLGTGSIKTSFSTVSPYLRVSAAGEFARQVGRHGLSRLFPTTTKAFLVTAPGVGSDVASGDPGKYGTGTWRRQIGQLSNPVLGAIQNVRDAELSPRLARARVWGFFPDGLSAGALGIVNGFPSGAINEPCVIATLLPFKDLPVNPGSGMPSAEALASCGGTLRDLATGDPELAIPAFAVGDQLCWGFPDGSLYAALSSGGPVPWFGTKVYLPIQVKAIAYGCVLTFKDSEGASVSKEHLLVGTSVSTGTPAKDWPITQGASILVVPSSAASSTEMTVSSALSLSSLMNASASMTGFRPGFDTIVRGNGNVIDITLPSLRDPSFPVQEIVGQHPPKPLEHIEGPVEFFYDSQNPLAVPALQGQSRDDAGDRAVPFMHARGTELDRLGTASASLTGPIVSSFTGISVYPDEIALSDGAISSAVTTIGTALTEPAALCSEMDVAPIGHGSTDPGVSDVSQGDLVIVEVGANGVGAGSQGILSVGAVETRVRAPGQYLSIIEPPRFITQTTPPTGDSPATGSPVRYTLDNAMVHLDTAAYPVNPQVSIPGGVFLSVVDGKTILDFASVPNLALNNGVVAGTGNLNEIWGYSGASQYNMITIEILARQDPGITRDPTGGGDPPTPGLPLLTITITGTFLVATTYKGTVSLVTLDPIMGSEFVHFGDSYPINPSVPDNKQIVIDKIGLLDLQGITAPEQASWFIPHAPVTGGKKSLYGYEFTLSVDTYNSAGNKGESRTAWIGSDRLSFHECIDLRKARPRGFVHPLALGNPLHTRLLVQEVTCPGGASRVNGLGVNGPSLEVLTFLPRSGAPAGYVGGTWNAKVPGVSGERGSLRVPAFEGFLNTPIAASSVRASLLPSSPVGVTGPILSGTGLCESASDTDVPTIYDNRITGISETAGALSRVQRGDIAVINSSGDATHLATTKAGTYLVRHAVPSNDGLGLVADLTPSTILGSKGWIPLQFPKTVSFDTGASDLYVTDLAAFEGAPAFGMGPPSAFPGTGRLYIVRDLFALGSTDASRKLEAIVSAAYTGLVGGSNPRFTSLSTFQYSDGSALAEAEFVRLLKANAPLGGFQVSGIKYLPIGSPAAGLPDNNVVGSEGTNRPLGFSEVSLTRPPGLSFDPPVAGGTVVFLGDPATVPAAMVGPLRKGVSSFIPGCLGLLEAAVQDPTLVPSSDAAARYPLVPSHFSMTSFSSAQWAELNGIGLECLLPGTLLSATFQAQAGLFLEPSFPRSVFDLAPAGHAHVTDATHSLSAGEMGFRSFMDFLPVGASVPVTPEAVSFQVRRVRRWHAIQDSAQTDFSDLRLAYEIRRGRVTAYAVDSRQRGILSAGGFSMSWDDENPAHPGGPAWNDGNTYNGTQLGDFNTPGLGIRPGDRLRVLDSLGRVVDTAEIQAIQSGTELRLASPGLRALPSYVGARFEVFLRGSPVPHEQSCEQLLEALSGKEVLRSLPDRTSHTVSDWKGGYVPMIAPGATFADTANRLYDDLLADGSAGQDFAKLGVRKGDIVVIDPAGLIAATGETGMRPFGDIGISARADHVSGGPDALDDNRGFYRVTKVVGGSNPYLEVSGRMAFAGVSDGDGDVTFPETDKSLWGYSVYPTITGSELNASPYVPGGAQTEGQMDLRPTRLPSQDFLSYRNYPDLDPGRAYSIRPFAYRIIRASKLLSTEAVDLALAMRERLLSLIEALGMATINSKRGSFYDFQAEGQASNLPSPTNPDAGMGILTNAFVKGLVGQVGTSRFLNDSDCLSILDRRFWLQDARLDGLAPNDSFTSKLANLGGTPYTAFDGAGDVVLPLLLDRIAQILDEGDRLRDTRYAWLAYRTHMVTGTLQALARAKASLPDRKAKARSTLLLTQSAKKAAED